MKVDALEVLRRHIKDLYEGICYGESIVDMEQAVSTFAELIAADEEYDKSYRAALLASKISPTEQWQEAIDRRHKAVLRRAAALLACKGQDHER